MAELISMFMLCGYYRWHSVFTVCLKVLGSGGCFQVALISVFLQLLFLICNLLILPPLMVCFGLVFFLLFFFFCLNHIQTQRRLIDTTAAAVFPSRKIGNH